jgi:hypothetical protein
VLLSSHAFTESGDSAGSRRADNKILSDYKVKPKNEDLIVDVVLALTDEVDRLKRRVQELEDR